MLKTKETYIGSWQHKHLPQGFNNMRQNEQQIYKRATDALHQSLIN
jgi:negative regulator of sigma E activity